MEDQFGDDESPYAAEGTLCHSLVAVCLRQDTQAIDYLFYDQNLFNIEEEMND